MGSNNVYNNFSKFVEYLRTYIFKIIINKVVFK